jgi:subtilisin family serine protease
MSHHQYNRIRSSLAPFIRLMLAIALLGLLASCGGGGSGVSTSNNIVSSDGVTYNQNESRLNSDGTPKAVNGETIRYKGASVIAGQIVIYLIKDESQLKSLLAMNGWEILAKNDMDWQVSIGATDLDTAIATIKKSGFASAGLNRTTKLQSFLDVNDPLLQTNYKWNHDNISLTAAWALLPSNLTSSGTSVGIVDGGARFDHEDLQFKSIGGPYGEKTGNYDFSFYCNSSNDGNNRPVAGTECNNVTHGMHVSGIIGASGNNGKGIAGIAYMNAEKLSMYRAFGNNVGITEGIQYFFNKNSRVINISMGSGGCSSISDCSITNRWSNEDVNEYIRKFKNKYNSFPDVLIVQAAGNEGKFSYLDNGLDSAQRLSARESDSAGYFASIVGGRYSIDSDLQSYYEDIRSKILIVGASDQAKKVSSFSNLPYDKNTTPFILAPGGDSSNNYIGSAAEYLNNYNNIASVGFSKTNLYFADSGTSMAAPHVTGVAALVLQVNPNLSASQVRNIILDNSDSITHTNGETYKALNAEKAVRAALATIATAPAPTVTGMSFTDGAAPKLEVTFDTDMRPSYSTGGSYVVKAGKEGYWPTVRKFVIEFDSYTPSGQITLNASGFVSTSGVAMAQNQSYTFPALTVPTGTLTASFQGTNYTFTSFLSGQISQYGGVTGDFIPQYTATDATGNKLFLKYCVTAAGNYCNNGMPNWTITFTKANGTIYSSPSTGSFTTTGTHQYGQSVGSFTGSVAVNGVGTTTAISGTMNVSGLRFVAY